MILPWCNFNLQVLTLQYQPSSRFLLLFCFCVTSAEFHSSINSFRCTFQSRVAKRKKPKSWAPPSTYLLQSCVIWSSTNKFFAKLGLTFAYLSVNPESMLISYVYNGFWLVFSLLSPQFGSDLVPNLVQI